MRPLVQVQVGPPTNPLVRGGSYSYGRQGNDWCILSRAHRVHISGSEGRFEAVGSGLVEPVKEMAVGVERGLDRSVTEPLLDDLRMLTLGDRERRMRVPQIVEGAGPADRRLHSRLWVLLQGVFRELR